MNTAVNLLVNAASDDGGFHGPTIFEFFPESFLFVGTPFEINRIMMVRLIALALLLLVFWLGVRRLRVVPGRMQSIVELGLGFVRNTISVGVLGEKDGKRFLPLITTIFFLVLFQNVMGIIPGLNVAGTSVIGLPLLLALITYVVFIYAGVKKSGMGFFKNSLFPAGVPKPLYILLTPIEFLSTFIIRPVTLTLRLLMNMMVGHLLLVLFFAATHFFFFSTEGIYPLFGVGTFAFGFIFTMFELLIATLQAFIFAMLTAVYIQLALLEEH